MLREPPNHKYHDINLQDDCNLTWDSPGGSVPSGATTITCVSSDEPDQGLGDGDRANDIVIVDGQNVRLRAERSGTGDGRCYVIHVQAVDSAANVETGTCTVGVQQGSHPIVCGPEDHAVCASELTWPNAISKANSDPWLRANHQAIRRMRPNVLLVNFVNGFSNALGKFQEIAAAYQTATRYHGSRDPTAPPFIELQLAKLVDLADDRVPAGWPFQNSTRYPRTSTAAPFGDIDYGQFFSATFASYYGYPDGTGGFLDLCALVDRGLINELWIVGSGDVPDSGAAESLESKQRYSVASDRLPGSFDRCAGNGCFSASVPVCRRSIRIAFINYNRGVGCFLESLGHSFEGMALNGSLPYLEPYFRELGMFNLSTQYGTPVPSWYSCPYGVPCLHYSDVTATSARVDWAIPPQSGTIADYLPACGNAHFAPNSQAHYDIVNTQVIPSTCAHFRMKDGPGGRDIIEPYSSASVAGFSTLAPDCTGSWQVYWRQNFPGLDNQAKDASNQPMWNWWPFLYY